MAEHAKESGGASGVGGLNSIPATSHREEISVLLDMQIAPASCWIDLISAEHELDAVVTPKLMGSQM